jgi:hypothetical protein
MKTKIKFAKIKTLPIVELSHLKVNREILQKHVNKFVKEIKENGWAGTVYIAWFDGAWRILDGQHRVEALKVLGVKEISCSIVDWLNEDYREIRKFIVRINAVQSKWNLKDYIYSWAEEGSNEYVHLKKQLIKYNKKLSVGSIATCYDGIVRNHDNIEEGDLIIKDMKKSDNIANGLSKLRDKYGKKIGSKVATGGAYFLFKTKLDYNKLLNAFDISIQTHFEIQKGEKPDNIKPLPDGDMEFKYWFENTVLNIYRSVYN